MRDFRPDIRARLARAGLEPTRENDIVEEIAQHLEERYGELVAGGTPPTEAAAAVLAELDDRERRSDGGAHDHMRPWSARSGSRATWSRAAGAPPNETPNDVLGRRVGRVERRAVEPVVPGAARHGWARDVWHDLRYAGRSLRKSRGFAVVTVLSIALGIGANTAIFQLLDALHLQRLPVHSPDELAVVKVRNRDWAKGMGMSWHPDMSNPLWERLRERQEAFSGMAAYGDRTFNTAPSGQARWARGIMVSGDFFHVLGVPPYLGRVLTAADDQRGCPLPAAVVSHGFWQRELGGDPAAVGRRLSIDGHAVELVGVAAPSFFGLEIGRSFDVAVPICMDAILRGERTILDIRYAWWLTVVGRLRPGWSIEQASAHLEAISTGLLEATLPSDYYNAEESARYMAYRLAAYPAATGISQLRNEYTTPLYFLLATAALVLLVACANLANLLLARASSREREIAVRLALGASRARLVRQLMVESLLIAVIGAALALLLARGLNELLVAFLSTRNRALFIELDPGWRVLGFTAGLAALTCVLFGLTPALRASRTDVGLVLKSAGSTTAGKQRLRLRRALVAAQVALSFVLLVGALLFTRSFRNLVTVDTGFRPERLVLVDVDLRRMELPLDRRLPVKRDLLDRVRATPGVAEAASTSVVQVSGSAWDEYIWLDGTAPNQDLDAFFTRVSPGYFRTLDMALVAGRDIGGGDSLGSPLVAVVSEETARRLSGGANPIGRRFRVEKGTDETEKVYEIVGVVRDSKYKRLHERVTPIVYIAAAQDERPDAYDQILVRAAGPPAAVIGAVKRTLEAAAPTATLDFELMETMIGETIARERLMATLSELFGLIAVVLASVGLYGVVAYSVARRTREIGIRIALGADRRRIASMIVRETLGLLAIGVAVGLALALAGAQAAASLLYGLAPHDPLVLAMAVILMAAVAGAACLLPVRRASRVEPMAALREE